MAIVSLMDALKRGILNRCPKCGRGHLLKKYIVPNKKCSSCSLDFQSLRADDGPAWATILISGHLSMPIVFWILESRINNTTAEITLSIITILFISAMLLPRAKGAFMALIWFMHIKK